MKKSIVAPSKKYSDVNIKSNWMFFDLHDGITVGSNPEVVLENSWGDGSIGGTALPMSAGALWAGAWSTRSGWLQMEKADGNDSDFALDLATAPEYADMSLLPNGACLVWCRVATRLSDASSYDTNATALNMAFHIGYRNQGAIAIGLGDVGAYKKATFIVSTTGQGGATNAIHTLAADGADDEDYFVAGVVDLSVGKSYVWQAQLPYVDDATVEAATEASLTGSANGITFSGANHNIIIGRDGDNTGGLDTRRHAGQIQRCGMITFAPGSIPSNFQTLVNDLRKNYGYPPPSFNGI